MADSKDSDIEPTARDFISIGKFIATFSQMEFVIRLALSVLLRIKNEHFTAVVGPYDFAMLCTVTIKILQQEFPDKKAEIEKVFKQCRALNEHRVRIAHSLWTHDTHGLTARQLSRGSLEITIHYQNPEELQRLTETAERVKLQVVTLCARSTAPILEKGRRSREKAAAKTAQDKSTPSSPRPSPTASRHSITHPQRARSRPARRGAP